ncbi:MAG TPA: hypothetical protein PLK73_04540, partial [Candidatus Omnitrophota bacterium]|nr:hypothetical protein [Candidatus Omnitrophota bacterium]
MMATQQSAFKPWLRSIALATCVIFTFTSVVFDTGFSEVHAAASQAQIPATTGPHLLSIDSLVDRPDLPDTYGTVKTTFKGKRGAMVVHIQDAHINEEAQRNIGNIIRHFNEKYQLGLVNLEGASGELYTELFSFFPNRDARKNVADYFLREGRLTGPEHLAIVDRTPVLLNGVEDPELYEENRQAYVEALDFKARDEEVLAKLGKLMDGVSRFVFPGEIRELNRRRQNFQEGGREMVAYVRYLVELAHRNQISLNDYPSMHSLLKLVDLEKQVDFNQAEKEVDLLINDLKKMISREKLTRFLTNTVHFRMKKMKRSEYYGYLQDEVLAAFDMASDPEALRAQYANVLSYISYMRLYDTVDVSIFEEIDQLERVVKQKLFTNQDQVRLDHMFRIFDIYRKMFEFTLTKQDAEFYYTYQDEFKASTFSDFLKPLIEKHHFSYGLPSQLEILDRDLPRVERFYEAALKRDQILIERAVEKTTERGAKISAIVTGGFHTPGIERYLRDHDISYMVVTPRISKAIDQKRESALYDAALRETPLSIENVLNETFLQPKSPVLNDPRFQLAAEHLITALGAELNPAAQAMIRMMAYVSVLDGRAPEETAAIEKAMETLSDQAKGKSLVTAVVGELKQAVAYKNAILLPVAGDAEKVRIIAIVGSERGSEVKIAGMKDRKSIPISEGKVFLTGIIDVDLAPAEMRGAINSLLKRSEVRLVPDTTTETAGLRVTSGRLVSTETPESPADISDKTKEQNSKLLESKYGHQSSLKGKQRKDLFARLIQLPPENLARRMEAVKNRIGEDADILFLKFAYDDTTHRMPTLDARIAALNEALGGREIAPELRRSILLRFSAEKITSRIRLIDEVGEKHGIAIPVNTYTLSIDPTTLDRMAQTMVQRRTDELAAQEIAEPMTPATPAAPAMPSNLDATQVVTKGDIRKLPIGEMVAALGESFAENFAEANRLAHGYLPSLGQFKAANFVMKLLAGAKKGLGLIYAATGAGKTTAIHFSVSAYVMSDKLRKALVGTTREFLAKRDAIDLQKVWNKLAGIDERAKGLRVAYRTNRTWHIWDFEKGDFVVVDEAYVATHNERIMSPDEYVYRTANAIYAVSADHVFYLQNPESGLNLTADPTFNYKMTFHEDEADHTRVADRAECIVSGQLAEGAKEEMAVREFVHGTFLDLFFKPIWRWFSKDAGRPSRRPTAQTRFWWGKVDNKSGQATLSWYARDIVKILARRAVKRGDVKVEVEARDWVRIVEQALTSYLSYVFKENGEVPQWAAAIKNRKLFYMDFNATVFDETGSLLTEREIGEGQHDSFRFRAKEEGINPDIEMQGRKETSMRETIESLSDLPYMEGTFLYTGSGLEGLKNTYGESLEIEYMRAAFNSGLVTHAPRLFETNDLKFRALAEQVLQDPSGRQIVSVAPEDIAQMKMALRNILIEWGIKNGKEQMDAAEAADAYLKARLAEYRDDLTDEQKEDVLRKAGVAGAIVLIDDTLVRGYNLKVRALTKDEAANANQRQEQFEFFVHQLLTPRAKEEAPNFELHIAGIKSSAIVYVQLSGRVGREGKLGYVHQWYSAEDLTRLAANVSDEIRPSVEALRSKLASHHYSEKGWEMDSWQREDEAQRVAALRATDFAVWERGSEQETPEGTIGRNFQMRVGLAPFEFELFAILDMISAERIKGSHGQLAMSQAKQNGQNILDQLLPNREAAFRLKQTIFDRVTASMSGDAFRDSLKSKIDFLRGVIQLYGNEELSAGDGADRIIEALSRAGYLKGKEAVEKVRADLLAASDMDSRLTTIAQVLFSIYVFEGLSTQASRQSFVLSLMNVSHIDESIDLLKTRIVQAIDFSMTREVLRARSRFITEVQKIADRVYGGSGLEKMDLAGKDAFYASQLEAFARSHRAAVENKMNAMSFSIFTGRDPKMVLDSMKRPEKLKLAIKIFMKRINFAAHAIALLTHGPIIAIAVFVGLKVFPFVMQGGMPALAGRLGLSTVTLSPVTMGLVLFLSAVLVIWLVESKSTVFKQVSQRNLAAEELMGLIQGEGKELSFLTKAGIAVRAIVAQSILNTFATIPVIIAVVGLVALAIPGVAALLPVSTGAIALIMAVAIIIATGSNLLIYALYGAQKLPFFIRSEFTGVKMQSAKDRVSMTSLKIAIPGTEQIVRISGNAFFKGAVATLAVAAVYALAPIATLIVAPVIGAFLYFNEKNRADFFKKQSGSDNEWMRIMGETTRLGYILGTGLTLATVLAVFIFGLPAIPWIFGLMAIPSAAYMIQNAGQLGSKTVGSATQADVASRTSGEFWQSYFVRDVFVKFAPMTIILIGFFSKVFPAIKGAGLVGSFGLIPFGWIAGIALALIGLVIVNMMFPKMGDWIWGSRMQKTAASLSGLNIAGGAVIATVMASPVLAAQLTGTQTEMERLQLARQNASPEVQALMMDYYTTDAEGRLSSDSRLDLDTVVKTPEAAPHTGLAPPSAAETAGTEGVVVVEAEEESLPEQTTETGAKVEVEPEAEEWEQLFHRESLGGLTVAEGGAGAGGPPPVADLDEQPEVAESDYAVWAGEMDALSSIINEIYNPVSVRFKAMTDLYALLQPGMTPAQLDDLSYRMNQLSPTNPKEFNETGTRLIETGRAIAFSKLGATTQAEPPAAIITPSAVDVSQQIPTKGGELPSEPSPSAEPSVSLTPEQLEARGDLDRELGARFSGFKKLLKERAKATADEVPALDQQIETYRNVILYGLLNAKGPSNPAHIRILIFNNNIFKLNSAYKSPEGFVKYFDDLRVNPKYRSKIDTLVTASGIERGLLSETWNQMKGPTPEPA